MRQHPGLADQLGQSLSIPVETLDPFRRVGYEPPSSRTRPSVRSAPAHARRRARAAELTDNRARSLQSLLKAPFGGRNGVRSGGMRRGEKRNPTRERAEPSAPGTTRRGRQSCRDPWSGSTSSPRRKEEEGGSRSRASLPRLSAPTSVPLPLVGGLFLLLLLAGAVFLYFDQTGRSPTSTSASTSRARLDPLLAAISRLREIEASQGAIRTRIEAIQAIDGAASAGRTSWRSYRAHYRAHVAHLVVRQEETAGPNRRVTASRSRTSH